MWMFWMFAPAVMAAPPQAEAMESIAGLGFYWAAGTRCGVEQTRRIDGLAESTSRAFEVRSHADGIAIHQTAVRADTPLAELGLVAPVLVIRNDGHFRRVEGLEAYIADLGVRRGVAEALAEPQRTHALALLDVLGDARAAQRRQMDLWERTIGLWSGLYVKETTSGSAVAGGPAPGFPGGDAFEWFYSFHIGRRAACAGEAGEPRCIELAYQARPWGKGMATLASAAAASFGVSGWSSTEADLRGTFLVEAATTLPVRIEEQFVFRGRASDGSTRTREVGLAESWSCVKPSASGS